MNLENQGVPQRIIAVPQKSKDVEPIEGLQEYETIYYRWFVNNYKDDGVKRKMETAKNQEDLLEFAPRDGYDQKKVERDRDKVLRMRENDVLLKSKQGEIFEHIISENIELHNWLGDNAFTFKTVEYDDRTKHTDLIVEWVPDKGGEAIKLAIDCTVAELQGNLRKKVEYIVDELEGGEMTNIDYFESQVDDFVGSIEDIPRIILAINKDKLETLCKKFIDLNNSDSDWQTNYLQIFFLEEIKLQLIKQIDLLADNFTKVNSPIFKEKKIKYGDRRNFLLGELNKVANIVENILQKKKKALPEDSFARADRDIKKSKAISHIKASYDSIVEQKGGIIKKSA